MKSIFVILATLTSGIALSVAAQTPASAPRIATIAFESAVSQTNEGLRDFADLKKKYQPRQEQFKTRGSQLEAQAKQLQAQAATLSSSERQSRAVEINNKQKQLQLDVDNARKDFQQDVQDAYNALAPKVYDVLNDYARQHGYTIVLDTEQQRTPVMYAAQSTDITKQVINAYNVKSGVPAQTVGGASAAPAAHPSAPHGH